MPRTQVAHTEYRFRHTGDRIDLTGTYPVAPQKRTDGLAARELAFRDIVLAFFNAIEQFHGLLHDHDLSFRRASVPAHQPYDNANNHHKPDRSGQPNFA